MKWNDGASYEGHWDLGFAQGKGVFKDPYGNQYEGEFYMSMFHGQGIFTSADGA